MRSSFSVLEAVDKRSVLNFSLLDALMSSVSVSNSSVLDVLISSVSIQFEYAPNGTQASDLYVLISAT